MMTLEEFTYVLEVHGTNSTNWPKSLKKPIEAFLANNELGRSLLSEFEELEHHLNGLTVPEFSSLEYEILNQELPQKNHSLLDRILNCLIPTENITLNLWRPAMAACVPLIFGIVLGNFYSFGIITDVDELDYWNDELALLAISDFNGSETQ